MRCSRRCACGAGQKGQQGNQLLAGQIHRPIRPAQLERAELRQLKCRRLHSIQTRPARANAVSSRGLLQFHGLSSNIHTPVTADRRSRSRRSAPVGSQKRETRSHVP